MSRVFSGIRPSGRLHIGNYLGAIKNWLALQDTRECVYGVVDYHAITTPFDPKTIGKDTYDTILDYLAAGLDPKKSLIVIQSQIPEHTELAWILASTTPLSWFERVPTYKEKIEMHPKHVTLGLLSYPALMAADILLYKATEVPVGQDQLPHLELTNQIARRFNNQFGTVFPEVKPIIGKGAKILSLNDPAKKMSKTPYQRLRHGTGPGTVRYPAGQAGDENCIFLSDSPETIKAKIKKAVTDSGKDIVYDPKKKPAISNLLTIYHLFSGQEIKGIEKMYQGKGYAEFKKDLAEAVIRGLANFREKRKGIEKDKEYVENVLRESRKKAREIASKTLEEVKTKIGLL